MDLFRDIVDFGDTRAQARVVTRSGAPAAPDPCAGVICPPGLNCNSAGACVDLSCAGVLCQPGLTCVQGACVAPSGTGVDRGAPSSSPFRTRASAATPGATGTTTTTTPARTRASGGGGPFVQGDSGSDTGDTSGTTIVSGGPYIGTIQQPGGVPWWLWAVGLGLGAWALSPKRGTS